MKNYRVQYSVQNINYHLDFSTDAPTKDTLLYSALYEIGKIHDGVTAKDISSIEPLDVW